MEEIFTLGIGRCHHAVLNFRQLALCLCIEI